MKKERVKALQLYTVTVKEKNSRSSWSEQVAAKTEHEAKNIGVAALETKGLINRSNIATCEAHCHNVDVWVGV